MKVKFKVFYIYLLFLLIQISLADKILRKNYDEVKQIEFNAAHNETNQNSKIKPKEGSDEIKGEGKKDKKEKEKSDEIDINIEDVTDMIINIEDSTDTNTEDVTDMIINIEDSTDIITNTEDSTDIDTNTEDSTDMITNTEDSTDIITNTEDSTDIITNTEYSTYIDTNTEEEEIEEEIEIEEEFEEEIEIEEEFEEEIEEEDSDEEKEEEIIIEIDGEKRNKTITFHINSDNVSECKVFAKVNFSSLYYADKIILNLNGSEGETINTIFFIDKWKNTSYKNFTGFPVEISTFELQQLGNYENYTIIFSKDSNDDLEYNLTYYLDIYSDKFIEDNDFYTTNQSINFAYKNNFTIYQEDKKILLTVLSNNINYDFNLNYSLNGILGTIDIEKTFFNGYSFIINNDSFKDEAGKLNEFLNFTLILDNNWNNESIEIKTRIIQNQTHIQDIKEHDHFDIFLNSTQNPNECFQFKYPNTTYILNFISYTKNIYINGSSCPDLNNTYISKESMSLEKNNTQCDIICFQLDETNDNFNFGSISFEVMPTKNENDKDIVIPNYFKTIRGLWTHYYLLPGTATYYSPKFNKSDAFDKISLHMTRGYPELYIVNNCIKNKCGISNNGDKIRDINGFISTKVKDSSLFALVHCPKKENAICEFDIEIKKEIEETYLFESLNIYSIYTNKTQTFKIRTKEMANNKKLIINAVSFPYEDTFNIIFKIDGDGSKKERDFYPMRNKQYYIINKTNVGEDFLHFNVTSNKYLLYRLNYYVLEINDTRNILENNMLYYFKSEGEKIEFNLANKNAEGNGFLNINSFGNNLIFNLNKNEYINFAHNKKEVNMKINNTKQIKLNTNSSFEIRTDCKDNYICLFTLQYNDLIHNKILIEDGLEYTNQLNELNNNNKLIYSLIIFPNDEYDKIVINFRKDSDEVINLKYSYYNPNLNFSKLIAIKQLSKIIILEKKNLICNDKVYCELIIIFESENLNPTIDFSIQILKIKDNNSEIIYLPQNNFMSSLIGKDISNNYYFKIEEGKEAKIYIDFLEGEGLAEIYYPNQSYIQEYNYINKNFVITKDLTSNCNGECLFNIKIFSNSSNKESKYKYNIYSIVKRDEFHFIVPELEYIYGNLIGIIY